MRPVRFSAADAQRAHEEWGANCGPGALAAILDLPIDAVRPALLKFDEKRYTNPAMMRGALNALAPGRHTWRVVQLGEGGTGWTWPTFGLCRVQWCGPWTKPGVPPRVAYRHTHWIGVEQGEPSQRTGERLVSIFDINCICVGGWVSLSEWDLRVVPWLLKQCEPKADGTWYVTHTVELSRPA